MNVPSEASSSGVQQLIDARCHEFEQAWMAGRSPRLEDHLHGVPEPARPELLRSLLAVELEYRRDPAGLPMSEEQLLAAHPRLSSSLERALRELRTLGTRRSVAAERTLQLPRFAKENQRTIEHTPSRKDSRGLHIRCPHCSNQVELMADTPYDSINCSTCGSMFSLVDRGVESQAATPLKTIDRFDLVSRLGVGGFGTVWKARDRELDRVVALKIPRRGQLASTEVEQFFREARAAAQLRHANIVPVHEVGRDGETLFIVSDFVRGVTLSDWLTGRRPTPGGTAELCLTIADALHHAHQHGIVHRDLKPSNIMIDEAGQPHLMDFGLAKREVGEITMTVDGQILGTPAYMSPEQAGGEGHWTDRRTDIYSLGVIMFEMLTGELPFRGSHQMQIHQRLTEDAPDPRKLNRHIPRDLATICLKCLEREPGRRYATAAELRDEFQRFLRGEPIQARPLSVPNRLIRWAKRKPLLATTAALTILLAVGGPLTAAILQWQRNRLAELVVEKDSLIVRMNTEQQQNTEQLTKANKQLDQWEGRANPWEFWPREPENLPRRNVVAKLFDHSNGTLANKWQNGSYDQRDRALGVLALAMLADGTGRTEEAVNHFQQARSQLEALSNQEPTNSHILRALAECHTALGRLTGASDRAGAAESFDAAHTIYERLAKRHEADVAHQVRLVESELDNATMAGFEEGTAHLKRASEINRSLPEKWPSHPAEVYRLACFLLQREPTLAVSGEEVAP